MIRFYITLFTLFTFSLMFSQSVWRSSHRSNKSLNFEDRATELYCTLNIQELKNQISNAPSRNQFFNEESITVEIPNSKGEIEEYMIYEVSNFSPELALKYPNIKSYRGISVDNPAININFSISHLGFKAMRMNEHGYTEYIELESMENDATYVIFSHVGDQDSQFKCLTENESTVASELEDHLNISSKNANDQLLRTYRLAVSVSGEYTQYFGGTVQDALAAINATMTRVNAIFERDFSVHMELIANNEDIIYTNATTDPYTNQLNSQLQNTLTNVIGETNYDVGHLFTAALELQGNAGCIGCVCTNFQKGSAFTSSLEPEGYFDIIVAHEMGHQFGANHTFSRSEGTGANREPGSGTTVMSYAGITSANVQQTNDDYFHYYSIFQVANYVQNTSCPTTQTIINSPPTANAGSDYTIPSGTAFKLTGQGNDFDNDALTYAWEQADNSSAPSMAYPNSSASSGPQFRSLPPSTTPVRYFPSFENLLNQGLYSTWERIPDVSRELNFNLQVRDNQIYGQTASDQMRITIDASNGPFKFSNISSYQSFTSGQSVTLEWDVAGTNASPFNSPSVNILFSSDGGQTFNSLLNGVNNNGSANVMVPFNSTSTNAYFMIESVENIFFAISPVVVIDNEANVSKNCSSYSATDLPITIPDAGNFVFSEINIPSGIGEISDINTTVDITHTFLGDLQIVLVAPDNRGVYLINTDACGNQDNLNATFDDNGSAINCASPTTGTLRPNQNLSNFNGVNSEGLWRLAVRDAYGGDVGVINRFEIEVCNEEIEFTNLSVIDNSLIGSQMIVYPNPSSGVFTVNYEAKNNSFSYIVFNMVGEVIQSKSFEEYNSDGFSFNLDNYPSGIYIIQIIDGYEKISEKILKK